MGDLLRGTSEAIGGCGSVRLLLRGRKSSGFRPLDRLRGDAVSIALRPRSYLASMLQSAGSLPVHSRLLKERFHG